MSIRMNIAAIVCCVALFASCAKEPTRDEQSLPDGAVRIVMSVDDTQTRATTEVGSDEEDRIANIKVFFYDHATQKLDMIYTINDVTSSNADADIEWRDNSVIIKRGVDQTKSYDIYVMVNWSDGFDADVFVKGSPITNLTEAFTRFEGQIVAPDATHHLLMSGFTTNHVFVDNVTATVALVRQVAKLRITVEVSTNFKAAYPKATFGAEASATYNHQLTIFNIPNSSYVHGPTSESAYNALMALPESTLLNYPTITIPDATTTTTVYVYENITLGTTAKERATFVVLCLPYKLTPTDEVVTKNFYKFYIQDKEDPLNPHKTVRNHLYTLTVTVNGFGSNTDPLNVVSRAYAAAKATSPQATFVEELPTITTVETQVTPF